MSTGLREEAELDNNAACEALRTNKVVRLRRKRNHSLSGAEFQISKSEVMTLTSTNNYAGTSLPVVREAKSVTVRRIGAAYNGRDERLVAT